jgi:hypothetical protein
LIRIKGCRSRARRRLNGATEAIRPARKGGLAAMMGIAALNHPAPGWRITPGRYSPGAGVAS